ncbi:maestro heat-like repeat-containing protein family member 7 isoform X2 [Mauremys reevesii]|uniref:maestro heat-like repeat-containing protein family member 7 isoform X2 n=1 Tax=Mauremys reevesii TaxID=260615 RepID=UPI00193F36FC|nr:maestro heat-like repeat-containing protein family member 7 isoform X2 [Mauremys reevesii]
MGGAGGSGGSCWPCGALAVSSPHWEVSAGPESLMLLCLLRVSQELIEELPKDSPPSEILASCLAAVGNLSTMKPALEPELESRLLQAALGSVFTLGTETDATDIQALHKVMPELLDAVLGNLLAESPDAGRLHVILEHVNRWIVSRVPQERARAIKSSTALLRFAVTLPEFDISAEFPRLGQHVAQLALFVSYPDQDISRQAREGTYRLYQLLLEQRGLSIHEVEDLWCHNWYQDSRLLGYKNTARVGEVFGKFFSAGQRKCFLKTAVPAIYNPLLCISQAGLLLTYAILGEAEQLLGYTLEDTTAKVMGQLRSIRQLHQVPEVLQGLSLT